MGIEMFGYGIMLALLCAAFFQLGYFLGRADERQRKG